MATFSQMSKLKFVEKFYEQEDEDSDDNDQGCKIKNDSQPSSNQAKNSGIDMSDNGITADKAKRLSFGLEKFLQKKRSFTIDPPPEIMQSDDTFLKEFHSSFIKSPVQINQSSLLSDSDDDSNIGDNGLSNIFNSSKNITSTSEVVISKLPKLKLFNLIYGIQEDQLKKFGVKHGFDFQSTDILTDAVTNLPSGAAVVYLPVGVEISACASALNGQDLMGRPVKAFADGVFKSRESLNSNRYFDVDISFKCNNCQEVCCTYTIVILHSFIHFVCLFYFVDHEGRPQVSRVHECARTSALPPLRRHGTRSW